MVELPVYKPGVAVCSPACRAIHERAAGFAFVQTSLPVLGQRAYKVAQPVIEATDGSTFPWLGAVWAPAPWPKVGANQPQE